jgi:hypothetical protein
MNICKVGKLVPKNKVEYTDLVIYGAGDPIFPAEMSIGYMTVSDVELLLMKNKHTVSLKTFYSIKNPEVVFLLVNKTWYIIDSFGKQINLSEILYDPVAKMRQVLGI